MSDDSRVHTPFGMFPSASGYDSGSIVALLSGGPAMTVIGGNGGVALVAWFDDANKLMHAAFPHEALYALDEDEDDVPYANADSETLH